MLIFRFLLFGFSSYFCFFCSMCSFSCFSFCCFCCFQLSLTHLHTFTDTGGYNGVNHGSCWIEDLQVGIGEVADLDDVADSYISDIDIQYIGQLPDQSANLQNAPSLTGFPSIFETYGGTHQLNGDIYGYGPVFEYLHEVDMLDTVSYRVELQLVHNNLMLFPAQVQFNKITMGRIDDVPEVVFMGMKVDHFPPSIHHTWYMSCFSQIAGRLFTQFGALLSADCNCLHCLCYSELS